ncbi:hypothetical protein ACIRJS_32835 [Streptomyces sp. NPDC102340]|uniref:hypothetical protein n=1 Tax=unclassified Streptomyces TaxID=2593676 RepID=UPI00380BB2C0
MTDTPRTADAEQLAELGPLAAVIADKVHTVPVRLGPGGADNLISELTLAVAVYCGKHVLPTAPTEVDVDTLARLLHDADVHVNRGDYPRWDDLSTTPGLGQDEVRKAARWLMKRLHITPRAEGQQP